MRSISILAFGVVLFGGIACGSDTTDDGTNVPAAGTGSGDNDGGSGGSGTDGDGGSSGDDGDGGTTASECGTAEKITECKEKAAGEGTCAEVGDCACDNCVCELGDCEADAGCTAIRACAQEKDCLGVACYAEATCQGVIDENGGPMGPSTALATALSTCVEAIPCPVVCD
jgi:hypothetical protein